MKKKISSLLVLITILLSLCACGSDESQTNKYASPSDLNGQPIGILTGTIFDGFTQEVFPDSQVQYYTTSADLITAIVEGKIEGTMYEASAAKYICKQNDKLTYFSESLINNDYGAIFPKNEEGKKNLEDFNLFLEEIDESGKLDEIRDKWFSDEHDEEIDYDSLPNVNGVFHVAADGYTYPFNYISNGKVTGYEVELVTEYCRERGYALDIQAYDFSNALTAVTTGKVQAGFAAVIYTEERAQSIYYSTLYASEDSYMIIRKDTAACKYNNINELKGQTIGALSGGIGAQAVEENIEDAQVLLYNSNSDAVQAFDSGKMEALCISSLSSNEILEGREDLKMIGKVAETPIAFILPKDNLNEKIENELNEFFAEIKEDGRFDKLYAEWFEGVGEKYIDYSGLNSTNGTINVAVCSAIGGNICYYKGEELYGMDIDIIVEFAKEYGYSINFQDYDFAGLLAAVTTGKADFGASNVSITAERKQSLTFTDPIYYDYLAVYVKTGIDIEESEGLLESIYNSAYKTFVVEDRYELFLDGINSTLLITFSSIIFGFILGAILFYLFRRNNKIMNKVLAFYSWLINGMPTVVLLMVFFYIVFGKTKLSGMVVSIISFTCIFSVSIMGLLKTCFMAVDKGQFEAAYALGYSKTDTIRKIIIPEIAPMFFPSFRADVITLLKSTSIVGYIAVQDLTKASDIVRSRTYEAFFPLIATTIIYFILGGLINFIIRSIEKKLDPKNRKIEDILKGVNYHD